MLVLGYLVLDIDKTRDPDYAKKSKDHLYDYPIHLASTSLETDTKARFVIYSARTWGDKGRFSSHSWFAYKKAKESQYSIMQVLGWLDINQNDSFIEMRTGRPDFYWIGSKPTLVCNVSGKKAEQIIESVEAIIENYPFLDEYVEYPGPNSNTFTQYVISEFNIEQLCTLSTTAIGKYYGKNSSFKDEEIFINIFEAVHIQYTPRTKEFCLIGMCWMQKDKRILFPVLGGDSE